MQCIAEVIYRDRLHFHIISSRMESIDDKYAGSELPATKFDCFCEREMLLASRPCSRLVVPSNRKDS